MQKTEKKKEKGAGHAFQYISLTQYTKYNNILNKWSWRTKDKPESIKARFKCFLHSKLIKDNVNNPI